MFALLLILRIWIFRDAFASQETAALQVDPLIELQCRRIVAKNRKMQFFYQCRRCFAPKVSTWKLLQEFNTLLNVISNFGDQTLIPVVW